METRSPSSSTADKREDIGTAKQAACLNCRRSKTRCLRNPGDLRCRKCSQTSAECVVPDYRVGRKKGIKNKRDGLEKAVHRIEQALKKNKTHSSHSAHSEDDTSHLQHLVTEAQSLLPHQSPDLPLQGREMSQPHDHLRIQLLDPQDVPPAPSQEEQFSVDDAENPLQLLARASDLSTPSKSYAPNPFLGSRSFFGGDQDLHTFFGPFRPSLDVGPEIDPIALGLVTEDEATALLQYFYEHLSHTRWGLDPLLHTAHFLRKQSSFLFTSIMAASALFIPNAGAISTRLSCHCKRLARSVIEKRQRSPEIVLAFMVNVPWMAPGRHWTDDETCSFMASALTIAMDLSLNKLIVPPPSESLVGIHEGKPPSECITARKALDTDGFRDIDPSSDYGRRLLRRRERIWLALFVLDRGVCLARGRSYTVPVTAIIENVDDWHHSSIAESWDGSLTASAVLRRGLESLILDVKKACDSNLTPGTVRGAIDQSLQEMIDGFFEHWYSTWAFATQTPGGQHDKAVPPYVEILVAHGRLSVYSSVINHPTAPVEVKRFFRTAGLSSSLNVLRASVQGETRLKSMPNNTAIMISFAACFALCLSTMGSGSMSLAPSIRRLIEESADVLERIGSVTPHRNGTSSLYGRHLQEIVAASPQRPETALRQTPGTQPVYPLQLNQMVQPVLQTYQNPDVGMVDMNELLQFSAMSDDQINEAINNVGAELEMYLPNFQMDDKVGADWVDWFNIEMNR